MLRIGASTFLQKTIAARFTAKGRESAEDIVIPIAIW
jgi:hypothetical protein